MPPPMYRYYQLEGGTERWNPCKADMDLSRLRPTFQTILAVDTLSESDPSAEQRAKFKYLGPLYFDIDAGDLDDAIDSAKRLHVKLLSEGLTDQDIEIYLSGKKGLHLLVPTQCFLEKPDEPVTRLPDIYRELAFKLAVPFTDFSVYSARRGRMLRTIYRQRENGLYKVAITAEQLRALDGESYLKLASQPSGWASTRPAFSPTFSMLYLAASQKIAAIKPRKSKPPSADLLKRDMSYVTKLLRGESGQGFNKIALQLAIYAREVGWTADQLIASAQGLVENHKSDSYRYNSPSKRLAALRSMIDYADGNDCYSYSTAALRNLVAPTIAPPVAQVKAAPAPPPDAAEAGDEPLAEGEILPDETVPVQEPADVVVDNAEFLAIRVCQEGIFGEYQGNLIQLSDVSLANLTISKVTNGEVSTLKADIYAKGELVQRSTILPIDAFTTSAGLHRELIRFGSGFHGTEMQARAVLGALMAAGAPTTVALNHVGLDVVKLPNSPHEPLRKGVLVWAGEGGSRSQAWVKELADFTFNVQGSHRGVSDLMLAPHPAEYFSTPEAKNELVEFWRALWRSNTEMTLGLLYGWSTACFYRPLLHEGVAQFPLLQVVGAAGYGKTQNVELARFLHTYRQELPSTTPNSTPFALGQILASYASTPILLDEYKPGRMKETALEGYRALFRDLYNGKPQQRGGGSGSSRSSGSWQTLHTTLIKAPLIFVAEALESEPAIRERSVPLTFTRRRNSFAAFDYARENRHILSVLGRGIVESALVSESVEDIVKEVKHLAEAVRKELRTPVETDTVDVARARRNITERPLYNTAVTLLGLSRLWEAVASILGDEVMKEFTPIYEAAVAGVKQNLLNHSATAVPEAIRFLGELSDMAVSAGQRGVSEASLPVQLVEIDGFLYLSIQVRRAFSDHLSYARARSLEKIFTDSQMTSHALKHLEGFSERYSTIDNIFLEWDALKEAGMSDWHCKPVRKKAL